MGKPEIAGPRRRRPGLAALEHSRAPSEVVPSEPTAAPALPPPRVVRRKAGRVRWFVLGAVLGAVGALAARGEAQPTLLDLREWSACELRMLEHHPQSTIVTAPVVVAAVPDQVAANDIPSVRVEDLPRVHPPTVARRHHGRRSTLVAPVDPPADADEEATPAPRPEDPIAPRPGAPPEQTAENDTRW